MKTAILWANLTLGIFAADPPNCEKAFFDALPTRPESAWVHQISDKPVTVTVKEDTDGVRTYVLLNEKGHSASFRFRGATMFLLTHLPHSGWDDKIQITASISTLDGVIILRSVNSAGHLDRWYLRL